MNGLCCQLKRNSTAGFQKPFSEISAENRSLYVRIHVAEGRSNVGNLDPNWPRGKSGLSGNSERGVAQMTVGG
jgi:hypothetical protein